MFLPPPSRHSLITFCASDACLCSSSCLCMCSCVPCPPIPISSFPLCPCSLPSCPLFPVAFPPGLVAFPPGLAARLHSFSLPSPFVMHAWMHAAGDSTLPVRH